MDNNTTITLLFKNLHAAISAFGDGKKASSSLTLDRLKRDYNDLTLFYQEQLGLVAHFSMWLHVDYLAPYLEHEEMSKRAKENRNSGEKDLNRLGLFEDEYCTFCNEAWHRLIETLPNGILLDPSSLEGWYKLYPDSLILHQKNDEDCEKGEALGSDLAREKMLLEFPKFDDHDRYYYIGNEGVGSKFSLGC